MSLQLNNIQAPLNAHGMVVSSDRVVSGDWPDHSPVTGDNITLIGRVLLAATLAGSLALGGGGLAQSSKPIVGISTVTTYSADARITAAARASILRHELSHGEFFSNPTCPGVCQPNPALPAGGTLTDTIVGGTGTFANATGNLTGSVTLGGGVGTKGGGTMIKLSGTITLAN